ncbi:cupin domain-containing protein [Rhodococcoides yunnanense]|uniref:cupin domain-containing protein n=1 Tax=Rhodococcoides yunnanense TaxID=278209 RepID=UPI0009330675|nr:cupin domain-containing protein [Rhodococcus yunnanensis]
MKRVVAAVNEDGLSYVASITELEPGAPSTLWEYDPADIAKTIASIDPAITADWIGPQAPGGVIWRYTPMRPASQTTHTVRPGIDENGFHTSRTIDFDIVVDGELTLLLDLESVVLQRGDTVIQQATRHAWKNESESDSILLALIHRPIRPDEVEAK